MLIIIVALAGLAVVASLPRWLPGAVVALRIRIFARINGEDAIDTEHTIPRGSVLCFNYPEFHQTGFDHPERFDPDRWRNIGVREVNHIPFGVGANRPCPARALTPLAMRAAATEILRRFTLHSSATHTRSMPNRDHACSPRARQELRCGGPPQRSR